MRYEIIKDEVVFNKFIDEILLPLMDNEQFYLTLFSRKKYDTTITMDKGTLGRTTATKEWIFDKIKKMEVELGTYKIGGQEVSQDSLVVYISPNPRNLRNASFTTIKSLLHNIKLEKYQNPKSIAMNSIQISCGTKHYSHFDVDIDNKREEYKNNLKLYVETVVGSSAIFHIIETKGGYHILILNNTVEEIYTKSWYSKICKIVGIDQKGDMLLPIPGCVQGDFIPQIL